MHKYRLDVFYFFDPQLFVVGALLFVNQFGKQDCYSYMHWY